MTLFGIDPPNQRPTEPTGKRQAVKTTPGARRPSWTSITTGRCDLCVADVAGGNTRTIGPARLRRLFRDSDLRLCYEHAQPIRAIDTRDYA